MVPEGEQAFLALKALIAEPKHQIATVLQSDEVLIFFNGVPHGRWPLEAAAIDGAAPRKLLRCRTTPAGPSWGAFFSTGSQELPAIRHGEESESTMRERWKDSPVDSLLAKRQIRIETLAMQRQQQEPTRTTERELAALAFLLSERGIDSNNASGTPLKNTCNGSYTAYYESRGVQPRINILLREGHHFRAAKVLDIGCNSGALSAAVAKELDVSSMLGVDIDRNLVASATEQFGTAPDDMPNVRFCLGDWGDPATALPTEDAPDGGYTAILCFSVTKWIHLNHGDVGLIHLFRQVHRCLQPGGIFVLEPQPLKSYQKVYCLSAMMKRNASEMRILPQEFASFITSGVFHPGFKLVSRHRPEGGNDRSQRDVLVFEKLVE